MGSGVSSFNSTAAVLTNQVDRVYDLGEATQANLANRLTEISPNGTADAADRARVTAEAAQLPRQALLNLYNQDTRVMVCRNRVGEHLTGPEGAAHPPGWPPGSVVGDLPGVGVPSLNQVVIAVEHAPGQPATVPPPGSPNAVAVGAMAHGSFNLVMHEMMHAEEIGPAAQGATPAGQADSTAFMRAWLAEATLMDPPGTPPGTGYYSQPNQGPQETYVESAARFFGGDPTMQMTTPQLFNFWSNNNPLNR
jgi:hypothetical protein